MSVKQCEESKKVPKLSNNTYVQTVCLAFRSRSKNPTDSSSDQQPEMSTWKNVEESEDVSSDVYICVS